MEKVKKKRVMGGIAINNDKINIALARKCWDVKHLAEALKISTSALYYQRYGVKKMRTGTAGLIAAALEVDVNDIVAGRGRVL